MKHKMGIILSIIFVICILVVYDLCLSKYGLVCTDYTVKNSKIHTEIRIAQLTDLHNSIFGEDNKRLIKKVADQNPDMICITGDLLNMDINNVNIALNLISGLSKSCPVFISLGNHEINYRYSDLNELIKKFEQAGATVLNFEFQDLKIKGETIRIGGLYGYNLQTTNEACHDDEVEFLSNFQNTNDFKLLLTHMPYAWYRAGSLDYWHVDMVLSGHTHGGQVRIPFIGALYAPDIGWFPGREKGLYYSNDMKQIMLLSTGLGSTEVIPRFNNIPEIVVLDIIPE